MKSKSLTFEKGNHENTEDASMHLVLSSIEDWERWKNSSKIIQSVERDNHIKIITNKEVPNRYLEQIREDLASHIINGELKVSHVTIKHFHSASFLLKSLLPSVKDIKNLDSEKATLLVRYINCIENIRSITKDNFILRDIFIELSNLYKKVCKKGGRRFKKWSSTKEFFTVEDIIRGNIETLCQHYSTTFGWQLHIQEFEKKLSKYIPLFITKEGKKFYLSGYIIGSSKLEKIEFVKGEEESLKNILINDGFYKFKRNDKNGKIVIVSQKMTESYLDKMTSPERFLEASDKILYKILTNLYKFGDKNIQKEIIGVIDNFREEDYEENLFSKTLKQLIAILYYFAKAYNIRSKSFVDLYDSQNISIAQMFDNRIWEWLYHFKFRLNIYEEVILGERDIIYCLEKAYENAFNSQKIPTQDAKSLRSWQNVVLKLDQEKIDSDSPESIMIYLRKYITNVDSRLKNLNIRLYLLDILSDKTNKLRRERYDESNNVYNKEVQNRCVVSEEQINTEKRQNKKLVDRLVEEENKNYYTIPPYDKIFSIHNEDYNNKCIIHFLNALEFVGEMPYIPSKEKNWKKAGELASMINNEKDLYKIASELHEKKDSFIHATIDQIEKFILSIIGTY